MVRRLPVVALLVLLTARCTAQNLIFRDTSIDAMIHEVSADSLHSYISQLVSFGTRHTLSAPGNHRGIAAARNWALARFREFASSSNGRLTAYIDTFTLLRDGKRVDTSTLSGNVVATLKGADPADNRLFLISAHIDNMRSNVMDRTGDAPGANDDGSGTAAVLECARIMSRRSFPATIIFIVVSGEEQGLLGAAHMAKKAKASGWNVEAVFNNDIMGNSSGSQTGVNDNTRVRVFSEGTPAFEPDPNIRHLGLENDGRSRQLARYVSEIADRYVDNLRAVMIYRADRFLRGGDQIPYLENGFPAVRITEMNEDFRHQHQNVRSENGIQYGDLIDFIDFEYLRKNTALNLACLAALADAPSAPQQCLLDVTRLTNDSRLTWMAPKNGRPSGYYVLVRETTSPVWQKKIFTPKLEITLPYSKDNYFFGVSAVNANGNESLPEIPRVGPR